MGVRDIAIINEQQVELMEQMLRKKKADGKLPIRYGNVNFVIHEGQVKRIEIQENENI